MFLQNMIFLVLTVPWFATGKKPKPTPGGSTITGQNELTLNDVSVCKGQIVQPDCFGRIILLDDSSESLVFGKGIGANASSCKYHDGDLTADMDLPNWVLRECSLKPRCNISADRLIRKLGHTAMYVMIKYYCIDRKPVHDMCQPITITGSTAYLISYGYPNMPLIEGITTECECTGYLMKKTLFSYRLLASDFKSLNETKCDPAQTFEIETKDRQKVYDCESQGLKKAYESVKPKGGKDYVNFYFGNDLNTTGGRFILEYIHNSDRFQLECNPDGRIMPPTTTTTSTTTTTTTPSTTTKAITSTTMTTMPTTRTTVPTSTITTPTTTIIIPTITTMPITSFTTTIPRTTTQPPVSFTSTTTTIPKTTPTSTKASPVVITTNTTASPQKFTTTQQDITKPFAVVSPAPTKPYISTEPPVLTTGEGTTTSVEPTFLGADPQSGEPNLGMIIGVIISVLVVAIIATIVLIIFIRRKKRRSKLSRKMSEVDLVETEPSSSVYCIPESSSLAVSVDAVGKTTSLPMYAVVNKQKGQDVPIYAEVSKTGKKGKKTGLNVLSDDVTSHSFENSLSGLPDLNAKFCSFWH